MNTIKFCLAYGLACLIAIVGLSSAASGSDTVQVSIPVPAYQVSPQNGFNRVELSGYGYSNEPGKPNLPSKIFAVAIPPGAVYDSFEIVTGNPVEMPGTYRIKPASGFRMIGKDRSLVDERNQKRFRAGYDEIYGAGRIYPSRIAEWVRNSGFRRYNCVDFRITPFQYDPVSDRLLYFPDVSLKVHYRNLSDAPATLMDYSKRMETIARDLILNYEQAQGWYPMVPLARGLHDYVIITTSALESSVAALANWEMIKGRTVQVVTVEWINSTYSGTDLAQKMRNFLREKYPTAEWGIEDVLFVGHHNGVPMRLTAQDFGYGAPRTDFYFAELSLPDNQSWDSNNNGQYADDNDNVDFYSEINVGRIPWSDVATVVNVCQKSVDYEMNDDPSYKKNMLLLGAYFWDDTDNAVLMDRKVDEDWMSDWTIMRMFEKNSDYWSTHDCDYPLLQSNVVAQWSAGTFAFVNWAGHGSEVSSHIYGLGAPAFIEDTDCSQLNDDYPAIVFADACSNSDTDYTNIGAKMIQRGAVGFVGATKVAFGCPGWTGPTDGSSQSLDYYFTTGCTSGEYTQGAAHQNGMRLVYQQNGWDYPVYEVCEWALWGNPDLGMAPTISSDGRIFMDRPTYMPNDTVHVTVKDLDLNTNPGTIETTTVNMTSSRGDSESLILTETGFSTAVFEGSISTISGNPVVGNGSIDVAHGDGITAVYMDASDGHGGVNVEKTFEAGVDGQAPQITNVTVGSITFDSIEVQWTTDEPSDSRLTYGESIPDTQVTDSVPATTHSLLITGLDQCTYYRFYVESADIAGNIGRDDNGGMYFGETTYELIALLSADMNTNPGWQISGGDWAWGHPTGGGGEYGCPDPDSGYTGTNVYGYNLSGDYANNLPERHLTTPSFDCSMVEGVVLSFWRWLGVERNLFDHARLQVSTNGTTWTTLWQNPDQDIEDNAWVYCEYDISAYADHQASVFLRWVMGTTDSGWRYCGWNIDDVMVYSSGPCGPVPTPTPFHTATSTPFYTPTTPPTATPTRTGTATPTQTRTPTPTMTPTPDLTASPTSTMTMTPVPPTHTPVVETPTSPPEPTWTPVPPTWTPVPPTFTPSCTELGAEVWMPSEYYREGDPCSCKVMVCNPEETPLTENPLFVILSLDGAFFCAPGFTSFDYYDWDWNPGSTEVTVLDTFSWPQDAGEFSGAVWYAALTDQEVTRIVGGMSVWTFGWGM